jgi:hypothetical protein
VGAAKAFIEMGIFMGQSPKFIPLLLALALEADAAERSIL